MASILITGGTGFIGSNLIRKLILQKNKINLLTKDSSNFWRIHDLTKKIKIHSTDLTSHDKLEKTIAKINPDIVFHLASYGVLPTQKNVVKTIQTNILGTYNLFSILSKHKVRKIVNVGSVFEYGLSTSKNNLSEKNCTNPLTLYGISKVAQTNLANYFFATKSLPIVTLRLFTPYGMFENKDRLISDIMVSLIHNKILKIYSLQSTRDFVFIDDAVDALIKSSISPKVNGKIFNIGYGKSYSVEKIIQISRKLFSSEIKIQNIQNFNRDYDTLNGGGFSNISQAKKYLNWKPKYSIEKGLEKTYLWYKNNISLYS